jgi:hypothetical protein
MTHHFFKKLHTPKIDKISIKLEVRNIGGNEKVSGHMQKKILVGRVEIALFLPQTCSIED